MPPDSDEEIARLLLYEQQDRRSWRQKFRDVGTKFISPPNKQVVAFILGSFAFLALLFHIYSVSLLRDTKVTVLDLILPDMCHKHTTAQLTMRLRNPSYCTPNVRSITFTIIAKGPGTVIASVQIPPFKLLSDEFIKLLELQIQIYLSPIELAGMLEKHKHNLLIRERYIAEIDCFLVPLTKIMQSSRDISSKHVLFSHDSNEGWNDKVEQLLLQILKTISLSHFRVQDDKTHERVFAFTTVEFGYQSRIRWNVPSVSLLLESAQYGPVLKAGMESFVLGSGNTHITAFTVLRRNESKLLLLMLKSYLASNQDLEMSVRGSERHNECYFLQLLHYMRINFLIPSQVDGKPVFLRNYAIQPYLKQLDSTTRKCLLQLNVSMSVNNPLPITFQLLNTRFDLYYKAYKAESMRSLYSVESKSPVLNAEVFNYLPEWHELPDKAFLAHINETYNIVWAAHEENKVLLQVNIQNFDVCTKIFELYLRNQLFFTIWSGILELSIAGENLSIPFQFSDIHVTPHLI